MKLGIIGAGNMAGAITGGIINKGIISRDEIMVSSPVEAERDRFAKDFGVNVTSVNCEVIESCGIILFAVKPQVIPAVIKEIREAFSSEEEIDKITGKLFISIVAGKTIAWYEDAFGEKAGRKLKLIRTMPNTPALVGEGMTGVSPNENVTEEELSGAMDILSSFGKAEIVPENLMDAVVAVSGSSPAYIFMVIEAMADGAVALGMPRDKAYTFAAQSVLGSAKMVLETGRHPGDLKDMVCSPAGTTIEAVRVLEEKGLRSSLIEAEKACAEVSRRL